MRKFCLTEFIKSKLILQDKVKAFAKTPGIKKFDKGIGNIYMDFIEVYLNAQHNSWVVRGEIPKLNIALVQVADTRR